jgi:transcriptional regulator with XRE-family HTH domain
MKLILDSEKLLTAMRSRGLSQPKLAALMGTSHPQINRFCNPHDAPVDVQISTVARLLTALKLSAVDDLLTAIPEEGDPVRKSRRTAIQKPC